MTDVDGSPSTTYSLRDTKLSPGQARHEELELQLAVHRQGEIENLPTPPQVPAQLDLNAMVEGMDFRLRFSADYVGPCSRCLEDATFHIDVDAHEIHEHGSKDEEFRSEFVDDKENVLDLTGWALASVALKFPTRLLCRPDCLGLCSVCGENQNESGVHEHEQPLDSRWDALKALQIEE